MAEDIYASRSRTVVGASVALMVLSTSSVGLRLLSRRMSRASLWWDDYIVCVALIFALGTCICNLIGVHYDFGKHVQVARPDAVSIFYRLLYSFELLYVPAIALVKISILFLYYRIFPGRRFRISLYVVGVVVLVWWLSTQITVIFECTPIHYFWTQTGAGHCIQIGTFFLSQAIPNIITDFVLLALPLPMIWNLQLPWLQRAALTHIFMLGGFVSIASIYRIVILLRSTYDDVTWNFAYAAIWSTVEPNVGVISACLPSMRPLLKLFIAQLPSSNRASTTEDHINPRAPSPQPTWYHRKKSLDLTVEDGNYTPTSGPQIFPESYTRPWARPQSSQYSATKIVGNSAQRPQSGSYSILDAVGGNKRNSGVIEGNNRKSGTFDGSSRRLGTYEGNRRSGIGEVEELRIPINAILVRNEVEWAENIRSPEL